MALENSHLHELHEALRSEESAARDDLNRSLDLSLADRVGQGVSWAGVDLAEGSAMRRRTTRVVVRGTLHSGIGAGDPVVVRGHAGRCVSWDDRVAELDFDRVRWEELEGASVVDLGFDADSWIEWRKALERADEHESGLKDALLHGVEECSVEEFNGGTDWPELNLSQADAAGQALTAEHLAVIHGPPGTGKTRTLVALLQRISGPRWALAESNAAVDNLALSASLAGLNVVRVGSPFRMSAPVRELSLDKRVANGPYAEALHAIERDIVRARPAGGRALGELFEQRREIEAVAEAQVIEAADVVAMTFGTLVRRGRKLPAVQTAVVDEVTQAIEPAIWAAVPLVQRMILAGDPHQLGPVVSDDRSPLAVGVLSRLAELSVPMPMLLEQHRMHAEIMATVLPVYGADYVAHPSVADHELGDLVEIAMEDEWMTHPVVFVDTLGMGPDAIDPISHSSFNAVEVALVDVALQRLRSAGLDPTDIAVITPYSAQVQRIAALDSAAGVEVATVNAFQGREAEVVIASFTRSNEAGELGFVSDRRRLTVAVTRARRLLWMCGDSLTLGRDSDHAELMEHARSASVWEPPWNVVID